MNEALKSYFSIPSINRNQHLQQKTTIQPALHAPTTVKRFALGLHSGANALFFAVHYRRLSKSGADVIELPAAEI